MNAFEIELIDRKEGTWNHSEFLLFAALCEAFQITEFVESVTCCHNSGCMVIDLRAGVTPDDAKLAIQYAAEKTLSHFWFDGNSGCKGDYEWHHPERYVK